MEGKVFCEKCGSEMTPYKKGHTKEFIPYISDSGITKKELLLQVALFYYIKTNKIKTILKKVSEFTSVGTCITAFRR